MKKKNLLKQSKFTKKVSATRQSSGPSSTLFLEKTLRVTKDQIHMLTEKKEVFEEHVADIKDRLQQLEALRAEIQYEVDTRRI